MIRGIIQMLHLAIDRINRVSHWNTFFEVRAIRLAQREARYAMNDISLYKLVC